MNKNPLQHTRPLLLIFIFITAFCLTGKKWLAEQGIDHQVLLIGNLVLFAVSFAAYWVNYRSMRSSNPQSSVRAMYGSFMIKFFVVAITAFIYIMMEKKNVNKGALMVCAGLYVLYTVFETKALMNLARKKKDA